MAAKVSPMSSCQTCSSLGYLCDTCIDAANCHVCKGQSPDMLICDNCDNFCCFTHVGLSPGDDAPEGEWYCRVCRAPAEYARFMKETDIMRDRFVKSAQSIRNVQDLEVCQDHLDMLRTYMEDVEHEDAMNDYLERQIKMRIH